MEKMLSKTSRLPACLIPLLFLGEFSKVDVVTVIFSFP